MKRRSKKQLKLGFYIEHSGVFHSRISVRIDKSRSNTSSIKCFLASILEGKSKKRIIASCICFIMKRIMANI